MYMQPVRTDFVHYCHGGHDHGPCLWQRKQTLGVCRRACSLVMLPPCALTAWGCTTVANANPLQGLPQKKKVERYPPPPPPTTDHLQALQQNKFVIKNQINMCNTNGLQNKMATWHTVQKIYTRLKSRTTCSPCLVPRPHGGLSGTGLLVAAD